MRCPSCGSDNPEGMNFCGRCGTKLGNPCPQCSFENPAEFQFCGKCGTSLTTEVSSPKSQVQSLESTPSSTEYAPSTGERRQLTVQFIDLVGSTTLSQQLDPEDYHARVRAYQAACGQVIKCYEGHIAQYLGDGVLVYFGYPAAHEEDAVRAVRSGLEIVAAVGQLKFTPPLRVRIGIHTGPVVVGEIGAGERSERLALGETPNIAARVQGQAEPNTVVISQATYRLVQGFFTCEAIGPQSLKNVVVPLELYRVHGAGAAQSRFEAAVQRGLTPLVGRAEELALLRRRWEQAKAGEGQAVLLNGEPGIGKSRLVQTLKEYVSAEGATRIEFRCSAYHQNSAFYPIIEHLQRLLQFAQDDTPQTKLAKLQQTLAQYRFPQADTLLLLAALLSLPHPNGAPAITLSPQKQKQKTQEALVGWIVEEAEQAAVYCAWEDLHWVDPSTLEVLTLFLDQVPTTRLLALLTFRPDFTPPWGNRAHLSQMTLGRLSRVQVREMVRYVTNQAIRPSTSSGRTETESDGERLPVRAEPVEARPVLPDDFIDAVVARTDGVPLFVEELTKSAAESVRAHGGAPIPPLGIPATLQDALMARLDRLGPAKEIAQVGATLGREFSYELLQAVSLLDEGRLQQGLKQLVEAELVYQRGLLPQAHYLFKHALIQDTAYQSLLKSTRQQSHRQIAQVLAERFPETVETQPELVAHHYTEAGLIEQALPYWQQAGERATQRSAYVEAVAHFTKGLEVLKALPGTPERVQQELVLQLALGGPLIATKGYASPEVEKSVTRAYELCRQIGETPQLFPVLVGLFQFYFNRGEFQTALELAEQGFSLAQSVQDPNLLMGAHALLGTTLFRFGELVLAQEHLEKSIALYDPQQHHSIASLIGHDPKVAFLSYAAWNLWLLGYPDHALKRGREALTLAQELSHPFSLAWALNIVASIHLFRREWQAAREQAEAAIKLCTEQGFASWLASAIFRRGRALAEQGQAEEGIAQIQQGLAAFRAMGGGAHVPNILFRLAEAYGKAGQVEEGLTALTEALAVMNKTGERVWEAELYRLKGELTLAQSSVQSLESSVQKEAEGYFLKAIEISRKQQAKSLELRAVMSLSRLWQRQGKKAEARQMLAEIYNWFTEGFDTKDLQEAKALLTALA